MKPIARRLARRLVLALSIAAVPAWADPAPVAEHRPLAGLTAPGRVIVDRWGIAHVRAANVHDAFFLQGWNAARDRLWQIDLWRKRGLGLLSASLGGTYLDQDRAARLLLYRGDMRSEWATYPATAHAETEAFVAGINAYVGEVEAGREPLPREFTLTGSRPDHWQADDVLRIRSHALVSNLADEVERARLICKGGAPFLTLHRRIEPVHAIKVPAGLDPCDIPADVLDTYLLGTKGVAFAPGPLAEAGLPDAVWSGSLDRAGQQEGSNNWAIDAAHSATGRPILANDPHRAHGVPSLRYLVDMAAPGFHIAGAGEPALPGVSFGHNETAAWGLTIFPADQEDLYVYRTSPLHPGAYHYKGRWEPFRVVRETVAIKGGATREVELKFTRHGPVIHEDEGHAFGLRTVWNTPGAAGYFNATWMFEAKDWGDFDAAHAHWGTPPLNLVYADVKGVVGWRPSAFMPQRKGWDGLLPVPGDGRYEWDGMIPPTILPEVRNPASGFVASANAINLPPDWPSETRPISFVWSDPSRIDEITTRLSAKSRLTIEDMTALQTDTVSRLSRRAMVLFDGFESEDPDTRAALALLKGWDGNESADSAPAALFEIWQASHLGPVLAATVGTGDLVHALEDATPGAVIDALARNDSALGADPASIRRKVVDRSLAEAWRDAVKRLGPDPAHWRWGALHVAQWSPAIAPRVPVAERGGWAVGPAGVGGSGSTPMATWDGRNAYGVGGGASVRMVLDVGAWDNSLVINAPGQSGNPQDAHYRDLFPLWAAGRYVPFLWTDTAVTAAAERVIALEPAG
ncbi:penicillin acylase family protein [Novosphingobium nitrogenifigens]|nr:penicillin acylase family protein [Novosphingobium nitrogenifigens]